jgi:hypothetical protein
MGDDSSEHEAWILDEVLPFGSTSNFEGGHWWVTSVERWREATVVQYTVETEQANFGIRRGTPGPPIPLFLLTLADDIGTQYRHSGGGAGGLGYVFSGRAEFRTPLAPTASSLLVTLHRSVWGTPESVRLGEVTLAVGPG